MQSIIQMKFTEKIADETLAIATLWLLGAIF